MELGVKDLEKGSVLVARRDTGAKEVVPWADLPARAPALLEEIQARRRALCGRDCARRWTAGTWYRFTLGQRTQA